MKQKNIIYLVYFFTVTGIIFWLGAAILAAYLKFKGIEFSSLIYFCYSSICHQIPSRSFFFFGHPLAVCARCFGIYTGFLAGTVFYPMVRGFSALRLPKIKLFMIISLPIVLDTLGNFFDIWRSSNFFRFVSGFIWGTILPIYFITGIAEFILNLRGRNSQQKEINTE